jgi:hypothetical protein
MTKPRKIQIGNLLAWADADPAIPLRVDDIFVAGSGDVRVLLDDGQSVTEYPLSDILAQTTHHPDSRQRQRHRKSRDPATHNINAEAFRAFTRKADDTDGDTLPILGRISPEMLAWVKSLGRNRSFHVRQALNHYRESGHYKQFKEKKDARKASK